MPLASTYTLQFYGNCCAAMVIDASGSVEAFNAKRQVRAALAVEGVGTAHVFRPYRAQYAALAVEASGVVQTFAPKRRIRAALSVSVNELTKDDVTGAVLEAEIEPGLSLKKAIRALMAGNLGLDSITDLGGGGATVRFRDFNDTKDRLVYTMDGSERVAVTRDLT
jgi:hypothetical protein